MSIAKKGTLDFLTQGLILALSFTSGIIVARVLGDFGRGLFQSVLFVNLFCVNLLNLGLGIANTYFLGKDARRLPRMHTLSVCLILIASALVFLVVLAGGSFVRETIFPEVPIPYLVFALLVFPFSLYYMVWAQMLIGLGKVIKLAIFNLGYYVMQFIVLALVLLVLPLGERRIQILIYSWGGVQVLSVGIMVWLLSYEGRLWGRLDLSLLKETVRFGFLAYIGNVASNLLTRIDWFLVSGFLGTARFGQYTLGVSWAEKALLIGASMEKATYNPVTAAGSKEEALRLVRRALRNVMFLSLCGLLGIYVMSRVVFVPLYGEVFRPALLPLAILLLGEMFFNGSRMMAIYFTGFQGKPQIPSAIAWAVLPINAVLCYLLVSKWEMVGAALAMVMTHLVRFSIYVVLFMREADLRTPWRLFVLQREDWATYRRIIKGGVAVLGSLAGKGERD